MPNPAALTKTITALAKDVYARLGSGFDEKVYENAMAVGLRLAKIPYQAQKVVELTYKEHYVGEGYPDLIVGSGRNRLILELKATSKLGDKEEQQIRNYLRILRVNRGLLINFRAPKARQGWK
jgi:GxxExxY protein